MSRNHIRLIAAALGLLALVTSRGASADDVVLSEEEGARRALAKVEGRLDLTGKSPASKLVPAPTLDAPSILTAPEAGGEVRSVGLSRRQDCRGNIRKQPDYVFSSAPKGFTGAVEVDDSGLMLVVRDPSGKWHCGQGGFDKTATVQISGDAGTYQVWVGHGSYHRRHKLRKPYQLRISRRKN